MNWKQAITICDEIDGTFPVHNPEPNDLKNVAMLQKTIIEHKKLLGVCFDGDGDRMVILDQAGQVVTFDQLGTLFKQHMIHFKKSLSGQMQSMFDMQNHGRFFFKDRHAGYADALYAFLRLLDILIKSRKSLHEILVDMPVNPAKMLQTFDQRL